MNDPNKTNRNMHAESESNNPKNARNNKNKQTNKKYFEL